MFGPLSLLVWIQHDLHCWSIFKNGISFFKQEMYFIYEDFSAVLAEDMLFILFIFDGPFGCNGSDGQLKSLSLVKDCICSKTVSLSKRGLKLQIISSLWLMNCLIWLEESDFLVWVGVCEVMTWRTCLNSKLKARAMPDSENLINYDWHFIRKFMDDLVKGLILWRILIIILYIMQLL